MRDEYIKLSINGCFWCERERGRTVDHLISKPLQQYLVANGKQCTRNGRTVRACKKCNFERAALSALFAEIVRGRGEFDKAIARRDTLKPFLSQYLMLVKTKLLDADKRDCEIELLFLMGLAAGHRETFDKAKAHTVAKIMKVQGCCSECGGLVAKGKGKCGRCRRIGRVPRRDRMNVPGIVLDVYDPKYPNITPRAPKHDDLACGIDKDSSCEKCRRTLFSGDAR